MELQHLVIGILAHVDAGKTTLAEAMLYQSGCIRKMGRVDHGDAFLDTYDLEKNRGITIFSKQAEINTSNLAATLLDTPGHVDFSAEMERTLQVLDYALLVISGTDGVQGYVQTLWNLLQQYQIPVFIFINKMDLNGADRQRLLEELKERFGEGCADFGDSLPENEWTESLALCDEKLLEKYIECGNVEKADIISAISERRIFPCFFGSALKMEGIDKLVSGLETYTRYPVYGQDFGARIYKISRDSQGNRLTHMKITGGSLKVKMPLSNRREGMDPEKIWEEKADQIRIYSGSGFEPVNEVSAGRICAVTGLNYTEAGEGLGIESKEYRPLLEPVLAYEIKLPEGTNVHDMFLKLKQLEEEEPQLKIVWNETSGEIHARVMGEIQTEILKSLILERFNVEVAFGTGSIVYKETIENRVEGIGHYEPLRHYAEVHLLMEPGKLGSGLTFGSLCSEDVLDRNWQRLILTHLTEKKHRGVLVGGEITDMKISLVGGRAHTKHTEGGDFRQATYRAVRQGLKQSRSVLLEPVFEFSLEVPADKVGRAMADIGRMKGEFMPPETTGDMALIRGTVPVLHMREYGSQVVAYTQGRGRLACTLKGYEPCHNSEEVIAAMDYDSEKDTENPTGSVFCTHGAGFNVPWDKVSEYCHVEPYLKEQTSEVKAASRETGKRTGFVSGSVDDKELEEIFERTYGPVKQRLKACPEISFSGENWEKKSVTEEKYLLVDGYNIIFSWEELNQLAEINIASARNALMDILCNYQGFRKDTLILVFDAYKVEGNPGQIYKYHNIYVVYTKEAETADQYIEKTVHRMGRRYQVTVATSDALEQVIILGQGGHRISARELKVEIERVGKQIQEILTERRENDKNYLLGGLSEDMAEMIEEVRLGKKKLK